MSEEQQVQISGDDNVVGDRNVSQVIKVEGGSTVRSITQICNIMVQGIDQKVFQQFGLEQRLGFILLGILIVLLGGGIVASVVLLGKALPPQSLARMTGDFRIAVAGFEQKGDVANLEIGTELAHGVYLKLQQTFEEMDEGFSVQVWGPDRVGTIEGPNADERASSAAQIAEAIGANLVIYGDIDATDVAWKVTPEFYVSEENFYEAAEISGQHALGEPFHIVGQGNTADRIETSTMFASRVKLLTRITVGLSYYAIHDFEQALTHFLSALEIEGWDNTEGKQVLYLLLGNTTGKMGNLQQAEEYYQESLLLDPEYARAYAGLASVHYMEALRPFEETNDPSKVDPGLIEHAISIYLQAGQATHQPALADVRTKVHFGLGQCYLMLTYSGNEENFDRAIAEFKAVIAGYGDGANPRVRELAAESHARLGLIYDLSGYSDWAVEEYRSAAFLLYDHPERRGVYEQRVHILKSAASDAQ